MNYKYTTHFIYNDSALKQHDAHTPTAKHTVKKNPKKFPLNNCSARNIRESTIKLNETHKCTSQKHNVTKIQNVFINSTTPQHQTWKTLLN
jgi:hypothetical protein